MGERYINKKMFIDNLPKKGKYIDWKNSIGQKVHFIYGNMEGNIKIIDFNRIKKSHLTVKYCNKEFVITTDGLKKCNIGSILGTTTGEFKVEIGTRFKDNKRDIIIIDKKKIGSYKYYRYVCNLCGFDCGEHYSTREKSFEEKYWILENHLLHGSGCACCCPSPLIVVEGINDIPTTNPELIPYFQGGLNEAKMYNKSSNQKIYPVCPDCGRIKQKKTMINSIYAKRSIGCSCSDGYSYPNKFMFNLLKQLEIRFISEYSPDWIGRKFYDFYFKINNKKYIVEMDGELGHGNGKHSKSKITIEESKNIDDYKDEQARLHEIKVIRIDCVYVNNDRFEYIKQNISNSKELNGLFDLSQVDFAKCNKYALSNLVKITCEYKRNNPDLTTRDMVKLIGRGGNAIRRYLKQGSMLGWCDYDPKEEMRKSGRKNNRSKSVEIFKNGISLGVFESAHELDRQSEKLFGVKLNYSNICAVCRGKRKRHKGFVFIDK